METTKETSGTGEKPRRVIKRYSNRKLYDTKDSRYVTLQQIGEMVRAGEEVQIIDNATKEDKTEVTLALIISEDLKTQPRSVPLGTLRDLIQERGGKLLSQLREGPIGRLIPGSAAESAPASSEEPAVVAAPEPVVAPPPAPEPAKEADKAADGKGGAKARFNELVESSKHTLDQWQHTLDERIRAIVPGLVMFRDLEAEVKRLSQRVEELEARLGTSRKEDSVPSGGAESEGSAKKE